MIQYFELGRVLKPQGVRGEVKIEAYTDDLGRFSYLKTVYVRQGGGYAEKPLEGVRADAKFAYLKFAGVDDRDAAEKLRGTVLFVDRANAAKLPPGHYYIADLVGLAIRAEDGRELGVLQDILQTGSRDVYIVKLADGGAVMFPSLDGVVLERNPEQGYITVCEEKLAEVAVYDI